MLTEAIIETSNPMTLNLVSPSPDEILVVTSITGLTPPELTLFLGDFARDGGYYQGRRAVKRNPVINFKLNPDYENEVSVSDIRDILYRTFLEPLPDTDGVPVRLKVNGRPDLFFLGYVEKIEATQFSKNTTAQVSMVCTDPFLKSYEMTVWEDEPGATSIPIVYDGSADSGLYVKMEVDSGSNGIVLTLNGKHMTLDYTFAHGDVIEINTSHGSRGIWKNGVPFMGALNPSSRWLYLRPGNNVLSVASKETSSGGVSIIEYKYRSSWWGI